MLRNEYVETLVLNGKMINIGQDDAGQCYFVEWVGKDGELKQEGCGTYNFNYKGYAEYNFGNPEIDCPYYDEMNSTQNAQDCKHGHKFGYCDKCAFQYIEWSNFQRLINLGIIDRRGNVNSKYEKFISKREDDENA